MTFKNVKHVDIVTYSSTYSIKNKLVKLLLSKDILSFDTETRSVYDEQTRNEANKYLKTVGTDDLLYRQAMVVKSSTGLSYPSIIRTTHFIFGESKDKAHVVICDTEEKEMFVWNLLVKYEGLLLVHNALFDLKIMYQRTGHFPKNYVDTSLMVKCLVNHVDIWKAKVGLKDLMGDYYNPKWVLMKDYEPEDLKHEEFINYAGIDGAATFYLYEIILEEMKDISDD